MTKFKGKTASRRSVLAGLAAAPAVLALGLGLGLAAPLGADVAKDKQLVIGHSSFRHLNPAIQSGQATGLPGVQIFAGLVRIDEAFTPQPYLAESWEVSEDGLRYTFHLRPARFHDGTDVTSKDVAFSLKTVKENHPFGPIMFGPVTEVETPDDLTAVLVLEHAHPALLQALHPLLMPILPEHVYGEGDIASNPANMEPIGSGPFKFKRAEAGQYLILERNEDYFLDEGPYLDELVFNIIRDPLAKVLGVERGEIDYLPFALIKVNNLARLRQNDNLVVTTKGYEAFGATNYVEFNLRNEILGDVRVRKAIGYAIDQDFIAEKILMGEAPRLNGPLSASNPMASEDLNLYELDLDRAKALLDEAGYPADGSGKRFSLTLQWIPDANINSQEPVANYLRLQLAKVGIEVVLRPNPDFASYAQAVANWDYELLMNAVWNYPDPVIGVHRSFLSSNIRNQIWTNTPGYTNERVDELLAQASVEGDVEKRKSLYAEFQKIVTDDLPYYWTNEEPLFTIYRKGLENTETSVWGPLAPLDRLRWN